MNLFMAEVVTGFLAGAGLWFLGLYVGLGMREDREADRAAKIAIARIEARAAAPMVAGYAASPAEWHWSAECGPVRIAGFADPFPRAGRFDIEAAPAPLGCLPCAGSLPAPDLPHVATPRPAPSPVDLASDVRQMCAETELYVAELIAHTRHTERTFT